MSSDGVDASDLHVPSVDCATYDVESLWLTQDGALIGCSILARSPNESLSEAGVEGVIDSVKSGGQADVLEVLGECVAVGEEGGET